MSQNKASRNNTAAQTAKIHGVTADYVRKIINGTRRNKQIKATYNYLNDGKNKLIREAEKR